MSAASDLIASVHLGPGSLRGWREAGFVLLRPVLSASSMRQLRKQCDAVLRGDYDTGRRPIADPLLRGRDRRATRVVDNPHWANGMIGRLATSRHLGQVAASLLGVSGVRLWATQLLDKPPGGGAAGNVGWHQDYDYWQCADQPRMLTAWLPLDDVSPDNGTLSFMPGSHLRGHLQLRGFLDTDIESQRLEINARMGEVTEQAVRAVGGQISLHHCLTLHCSGPNNSSKRRRALSIHMMADGTTYRSGTSCDAHPNVILLGGQEADAFEGRHFPVIYSALAAD